MTKRKLLGLSMLLLPFVVILTTVLFTEGLIELLRLLGSLGLIMILCVTSALFIWKALDLLEDK